MIARLFDYTFLGNTLGNYFLIVGIIMLAFSVKRFMSRHIAGLVFGLVKRIANGVDKKSFVDLVVIPLEQFLLILITIIALDKLHFPDLLNVYVFKVRLQRIIEVVAIVILIVSLITLMLRIIEFVAIILEEKSQGSGKASENQLILFFKDFFKAMLVILGILMALKFAFNFKITSLITGLSLAGAAIALATRESIENLIASFIIFFDKPFTTGDMIKVQNIQGTVEKIGLRSTRLRTTQKTYVTVPNKQMVDSIMDNITLQTQRRAFVQLELHPETTHDMIHLLTGRIGELMQLNPRIENHTVFLADIVKGAYIVTVEYFTATIPATDFNELRQAVNLSIIEMMEDLGVRLANKDGGEVKV